MPHTDAATLLQNAGFQLVEYGEQQQYRLRNPVMIQTLEWAIPDEDVSLASQTLHENGFPLGEPSQMLISAHGKWESTGFVHRSLGRRIHIYPLRFISISLDDTVEAMSPFASQPILTPKPPMYMLSLIRYLLKCPAHCNNRRRAQGDLLGIITYFVFRYEDLMYGEEDESEEVYQGRVEKAVLEVRGWDWGNTEEKYLDIVEKIIQDCRVVKELPDS